MRQLHQVTIADGPHAGLWTEIVASAPATGLERGIGPDADAWLAAALAPEQIDRDAFWYVAVYDSDPAENSDVPGRQQLRRHYRYRELRVVAKHPAPAAAASTEPAVEKAAALKTSGHKKLVGPAAPPLTLF